MMTTRLRKGLTLLEILVAIVVVAIVLGIGHRVLSIVGDHAIRHSHSQAPVTLFFTTLRNLALQIDLRSGSMPLRGTEASAQFSSWCTAAAGWPRRCDAHLTLHQDKGRCRALLKFDGDSVSLATADPCKLGYLIDAESGGHWALTWTDTERTPLAIQISLGSDTLLVRLGRRG